MVAAAGPGVPASPDSLLDLASEIEETAADPDDLAGAGGGEAVAGIAWRLEEKGRAFALETGRDGWRGRWRMRSWRDGRRDGGGDLRWTGRGWTVLAGAVALRFGDGLLLGRPDRGRRVGAATGLVDPPAGLVLLSPLWRPRRRTGIAVARRGPRWRVDIVGGAASRQGHDDAWSAAVRYRSRAGELGMAACGAGRGRGGSVSVSRRRGPWLLEGEWASWRPYGGGRTGALSACLVRHAPRWRLEGRIVRRAAGFRSPLTGQSGLLGTDAGTGWALRGTGRSGGLTGKVLLSGSVREPAPPAVSIRESGSRRELDLAGRWLRARIGLRWRSDVAERTGWPDGTGWGTPGELGREISSRLALWSRIAAGTRETSVMLVRARRRVDGDVPATRWLLWGRHDRSVGTRVTLRCQWGTSWGDRLDLFTVETPWPGALRPRHWGLWRERWTVSLFHPFGTWRWGVSLSRSVPEAAADATRWELVVSLARGRRCL